MSKFQMYRDAAEKFRFRLRAANNRIVAFGEAYEQRASCLNGIRSVQRNCGAPVEDLTVESGSKLPNPKYQVFQDAKGKFRFHLKAANGEIIAQGEGYESKEACFNGIEVVRGCRDAVIEDSTTSIEEVKDVEVSAPEILSNAAASESEMKTKVEGFSPKVTLEEIPKQASFSTADMTPKESYPWESKLELYAVPQAFSKGTRATLNGKLSSAIKIESF